MFDCNVFILHRANSNSSGLLTGYSCIAAKLVLTTTSFPLLWHRELNTQLGWTAFNRSCACCVPAPLSYSGYKAKNTRVPLRIVSKVTLVTFFAWASEAFYLLSHGGWHMPIMCSLRNAAGGTSCNVKGSIQGPYPVSYYIFPSHWAQIRTWEASHWSGISLVKILFVSVST